MGQGGHVRAQVNATYHVRGRLSSSNVQRLIVPFLRRRGCAYIAHLELAISISLKGTCVTHAA